MGHCVGGEATSPPDFLSPQPLAGGRLRHLSPPPPPEEGKMEGPPAETLGQKLQRLREAQELTQEALAERAQVPVSSLRNWEYGHRQARSTAVLRLAKALGVDVEELLQAQVGQAGGAEV